MKKYSKEILKSVRTKFDTKKEEVVVRLWGSFDDKFLTQLELKKLRVPLLDQKLETEIYGENENVASEELKKIDALLYSIDKALAWINPELYQAKVTEKRKYIHAIRELRVKHRRESNKLSKKHHEVMQNLREKQRKEQDLLGERYEKAILDLELQDKQNS